MELADGLGTALTCFALEITHASKRQVIVKLAFALLTMVSGCRGEDLAAK